MRERKAYPSFLTKALSWIIAFCGLWEFGDFAALFVPDFGPIPAFLWNHILTGLLLVIAGAWAALTRDVRTAKRLDWMAAALGAWLVMASFLLRNLAISAGLWNDLIVGSIVFILGTWATLAAPRVAA